ncbi:DMT family transporter [Microbacterium sp. 179-B 1A2 NHS]|uniref:DMT family transporter n=1 Tax=Microbacterium sp. 179-B 1A2 NHS TaxID=3142383 RepID=UPI0039A19583
MRRPDAGTVVAFILTGIVWGAGFLFIRLAVAGMSPVQFVLLRTALAAVVLMGAMAVMRRSWPRGVVAWSRIATLGTVGCAIPFLFYASAGQRIPSGLSSIYNAAVPVATALVTIVATRQERLGARKLLAIGLGAVGILIVMAPWQLDSSVFDLWGQLACVAAVLGLGFAFSYTRKAITPLGLDPIGIAMGQMLVCAILLVVVLPFTGPPEIRWDASVITALVLSGILATGIAYIWNFRVIDRWGAASASMVTYLTTLVGVSLGILVLHEPISLNQVLGAAVVLVGVAVGVSSPRRPRLP